MIINIPIRFQPSWELKQLLKQFLSYIYKLSHKYQGSLLILHNKSRVYLSQVIINNKILQAKFQLRLFPSLIAPKFSLWVIISGILYWIALKPLLSSHLLNGSKQ